MVSKYLKKQLYSFLLFSISILSLILLTFFVSTKPTEAAISAGSKDTSFFSGDGLNYNLANNYVYAISVQSDGKVLIGGAFTTFNGISRGRVARLNSDGSLDTSFLSIGTGANSEVYSISVQNDGKILIGGNFTTYNGVSRGSVARLNSDGSLDTSFLSSGAGGNLLLIQYPYKVMVRYT